MQYPSDCCSDDGKECAPVPESTITEVQGGFRVDLMAGQHHNLKSGRATRFFPHGSAGIKFSTDGKYHACVGHQWVGDTGTVVGGIVYCIIIPPPIY